MSLKGQYLAYFKIDQDELFYDRIGLYNSSEIILKRNVGVEQDDQKESDKISAEIIDLSRQHERIRAYALAATQIAAQTAFLPAARMKAFVRDRMPALGKLVRERPGSQLYMTNSLDIGEITKEIDNYKAVYSNSYAVRQAILAGMVSIFDEIVGGMVRVVLRHNPSVLKGMDRSVPYHELADASDFNELRDRLLDEVAREQSWKSRADQIGWFEKFLGRKDILKGFESYYRFIELSERRNLYVHNDGVVSQEYLRRVKAATGQEPTEKVGVRLSYTRSYMSEAADTLIEMSTFLGQTIARKLAGKSIESIQENIDSEFNESVFQQIKSERYDSACRLARMMSQKEFGVSDLFLKMNSVNYAISCARLGRDADRDKVLDDVDWSSCGPEFHLSVAAVKGDLDRVCELIPKLVHSDWVKPDAYYQWPAFDSIRGEDRFWATLVEVYGEEIKITESYETHPSPDLT